LQKIQIFIQILLFGCFMQLSGQNNQIRIAAKLLPARNSIEIEQTTTYYNTQQVPLNEIYLHNWANAYQDQKSPLAKRLLENYDRSLYFAKTEEKGYSDLYQITIDDRATAFDTLPKIPDIVKVTLPKTLYPNDSVTLRASYLVKVPEDDFTGYGNQDNNYMLRFWYLIPAVFDGNWNLMSNLDMDDIYVNPSDFQIEFSMPRGFTLQSDLNSTSSFRNDEIVYFLEGKNRVDVEISIELINTFDGYETEETEIITNLDPSKLNPQLKTDVLNRQMQFIEEYLGKYPHDKLLVSKVTYNKNKVYGLNQLPKKLNPFSAVFEWDIKMFKALTRKYIENTVLTNSRSDYYLPDGIQIFLMMEYVDKYYPEIKAIGEISKLWGIRTYNFAKLDFNDTYPFVYQFATQKNLDQSLVTQLDSLSNFNRKIVNKYKAGLGLRYVDAFLGDSLVKTSLNEFYEENKLKLTSSDRFRQILSSKTEKDFSSFYKDYVTTNKKIDYTITKAEKSGDSLNVTIKNMSNFTAPVALYGLKNGEITHKEWVEGIDSIKTVTLAKNDFDRISLNYEFLYPENNHRNNWKKVDNALLNRPLKLTFFKDVEDPFYNQLFYNLIIEYNYYEGLVLGPQFYNQALFKKKWLFKVTPTYGFKSQAVSGSIGLAYQHLPENTRVYSYDAGLSASNSFYDADLRYKKFYPTFVINFNRKSLRDVGGSYLMTRYNFIDKDVPEGEVQQESDKYQVLDIRYGYGQPNIINDLSYFIDFQYHEDFTKLALDFRYRFLNDKNRQYDFRFFFGNFFRNKTTSDYFNFALDRPSDYLFEYGYFGRFEETGFFSQEIIISDGGFKSIFEDKYASQYMASVNASIGIWRWIELYGDAGIKKNQQSSPDFYYDSGIRFNFVHNFVEIYFPLQSSLGFEPSLPDYASKIRFVLTGNPSKIYNFIKRGFY